MDTPFSRSMTDDLVSTEGLLHVHGAEGQSLCPFSWATVDNASEPRQEAPFLNALMAELVDARGSGPRE